MALEVQTKVETDSTSDATPDAAFTSFLSCKPGPPFDKPNLELSYEIEHCLSDVINTFKSMVFETNEVLPDNLKELVKFSKRKCTYSQKSKSSSAEFEGNTNGNLCEVIKFDVTLLPLLPGFDQKEYEKQKQEEEKKNCNENESQSTWSSWTSMSSWQEWGSSIIDSQSWANSFCDWIEYFNMSLDANEIWKIDWIQHRAISFVKNITMSWTVAVYEYTEIEQLMHLSHHSEKVLFIKKLYIHPIVPLPQFAMDLLKNQYKKDSDVQIELINSLISKPLTKHNKNDKLQQLQAV